jgi:rhodanese-related sulfurtransferase
VSGLDQNGLPLGYAFKPDLEVTPRQVKKALEAHDPKLVLVDCRTQEEWEIARIEGATLVPLDELASRVPEIEDMADDEDATIAVVCHHGNRSLRAALFLRQHGLPAMSVAGGIDLWSVDVDPSVPRY